MITATDLLATASTELGRGLRPTRLIRRDVAACGVSECLKWAVAVDVRTRHWWGGRYTQDVYFHCEDHAR